MMYSFKSLRRGDNRKRSISKIGSECQAKSIACVLILVAQRMQFSLHCQAAANSQALVLSFFLFAALCGSNYKWIMSVGGANASAKLQSSFTPNPAMEHQQVVHHWHSLPMLFPGIILPLLERDIVKINLYNDSWCPDIAWTAYRYVRAKVVQKGCWPFNRAKLAVCCSNIKGSKKKCYKMFNYLKWSGVWRYLLQKTEIAVCDCSGVLVTAWLRMKKCYVFNNRYHSSCRILSSSLRIALQVTP